MKLQYAVLLKTPFSSRQKHLRMYALLGIKENSIMSVLCVKSLGYARFLDSLVSCHLRCSRVIGRLIDNP